MDIRLTASQGHLVEQLPEAAIGDLAFDSEPRILIGHFGQRRTDQRKVRLPGPGNILNIQSILRFKLKPGIRERLENILHITKAFGVDIKVLTLWLELGNRDLARGECPVTKFTALKIERERVSIQTSRTAPSVH